MADLLKRVAPGDLITNEKWNLIVDAVNELLQTGQSSGLTIASIVPAGTVAEPIRIGTVLQITGQSFGYSVGQSSVTFQSEFGSFVVPRSAMLTGSSDTRLLLIVPAMPGLPQAGANAALRVDNGVAQDQRSVFVTPVVVTLQGDVFVNWRSDVTPNPAPNPLVVNQPAEFAYRVTTGTNLPAAFDLSAAITDASVPVPAGLVDSIQFLDRTHGNVLIPNKRVDMGKAEVRDINLRIPTLPSAFGAQTFTLRVTAAAGTIVGTDARSFTVGTPVPPSDPTIDLQQTGTFPVAPSGSSDPPANNALLEGTTIKLRAGWQLILIFNARFTPTGTPPFVYEVSIQPKSGTLTGWTLQLVNTAPTLTVAAGETRMVMFGATATSTADATGTIVFRVRRQGAASDQTKEYSLQRLT